MQKKACTSCTSLLFPEEPAKCVGERERMGVYFLSRNKEVNGKTIQTLTFI